MLNVRFTACYSEAAHCFLPHGVHRKELGCVTELQLRTASHKSIASFSSLAEFTSGTSLRNPVQQIDG
jgi:hypothetical protein